MGMKNGKTRQKGWIINGVTLAEQLAFWQPCASGQAECVVNAGAARLSLTVADSACGMRFMR
jgi:hypothetical protein